MRQFRLSLRWALIASDVNADALIRSAFWGVVLKLQFADSSNTRGEGEDDSDAFGEDIDCIRRGVLNSHVQLFSLWERFTNTNTRMNSSG